MEKLKISAVSWDGDKEPRNFYLWVEHMDSMVRSTLHGPPLVDMLDSKLKRIRTSAHSVPSFLREDPDFAPLPEASLPSGGPEASSGDTTSGANATANASVFSAASGYLSLGQHSVAYCDLPKDSRDLDGLLYNILLINVKGSKNGLLQSVTFPSYVQGMVILHKHMDLSRMDRIMNAFSELQKLTYQGDVALFQTKFMSLERELDNCKANLTHLKMCVLMRAFDGKSKTLQYKIADDFNKLDTEDPSFNFYDLVQKYCADLSAVGDGKTTHRVSLCSQCQGDHQLGDCPSLKQTQRNEVKRQQNEAKKNGGNPKRVVTCHHCGEVGHIKPNCPKKTSQKETAKAMVAQQQEAPAEDPPAYPATPGAAAGAPVMKAAVDTSKLTPEQLQQVVQHIRMNRGSVNMVRTSTTSVQWSTATTSVQDMVRNMVPTATTSVQDNFESEDAAHSESAHDNDSVLGAVISGATSEVETQSTVMSAATMQLLVSSVSASTIRRATVLDERTAFLQAEFDDSDDDSSDDDYSPSDDDSSDDDSSSVHMDRPPLAPSAEHTYPWEFDPVLSGEATSYFADGTPLPSGWVRRGLDYHAPPRVYHMPEEYEAAQDRTAELFMDAQARFEKFIQQSGIARVLMTKVSLVPERIHLSLCDGMGTALTVMKLIGADITRCIGVENNEMKRTICDNMHPPDTCSVGGVEHTWHSNVFDIKREDIAALGKGSVVAVDIAADCTDFSLLRNLPSKYGPRGKLKVPRPGLKGPKGAVLVQCILVTSWVIEDNPEVEVFCENIKFADLVEDWALMAAAFGEPLVVDSADVSYTRRVRAYWTNIPYPTDVATLTAGFAPMDSSMCMDVGRTCEPYKVDGKTTVRTIAKSWAGNPNSPYADTQKPVIVLDEQFEEAQHVRSVEVEQLLGHKKNATAGRGATEKDRLTALGDGWDLNTVVMIKRFSKLARVTIDGPPYPPALSQPPMGMLTKDDDMLIALLSSCNREEQMMLLSLLEPHPSTVAYSMYSGSCLDSGSSRHISPHTMVTQSDACIPLTGFNESSPSVWTTGNGYLPLTFHDQRTDSSVALDIDNVDKLDTVTVPILSMGKLLRKGFKFYFESPEDLVCMLPGGHTSVAIELGGDDILRIPHAVRKGTASAPIPVSPAAVMKVTRIPESHNSEILHDIFCHRNMEKIYQTLRHTIGYEAVRLPDFFCDICAQMRAIRKGLSHSKVLLAWQDVVEGDVFPVGVNFEHDPTYDDDNFEDGDDPSEALLKIEYTSPVAGRSLGLQPIPRFDIDKLRPFEVMFVDNKDYEQFVRGGRQVAFVLYDLKTTAKFKIDTFHKDDNGLSFRKIAVENGVHKLAYQCTVYSDGCGSMAHVEIAAVLMGINHVYIPPHEQSLNEAETICHVTWDDAASLMHRSRAPSYLFAEAVSFAMYVDLRTATTKSRGFLTPYEMIKGVAPNIQHLHRFYTAAFVCVPRSKRKALAKKGFLGRAEVGRLLGFQKPYSNTYRVLLSGNRLVHNINVTFDDSNCVHGALPPPPSEDKMVPLQPMDPTGNNPAANQAAARDRQSPSVRNSEQVSPSPQGGFSRSQTPMAMSPMPSVAPSPEQDIFDLDDPGLQQWRYNEPNTPPARVRSAPLRYGSDGDQKADKERREAARVSEEAQVFLCRIMSIVDDDPDTQYEYVALTVDEFTSSEGKVDNSVLTEAGFHLAMMSQKDMNWKKALQGPESAKAIAAFQAERDSLLSTVLTLVDELDPEYETLKAIAITGRYLLDIKRSGSWKARGVKHGFKEDKAVADGEGFQYYSSTVKLYTVRISFFRPNRGTRRAAVLDERTAFLQADEFPEELVKALLMWDPIRRKWELFKQSGPLYGENSAPRRWEDTYAPYLESEGFIRGHNERAAFYHPDRDVLDLTWVDDNYLDGEEDDILFAVSVITDRFECKELEWIPLSGEPVDYLGMEMSMTPQRTLLCMEVYITDCLETLEWTHLKPARIPIRQAIDTESPLLEGKEKGKFHTALGMIGWLSLTARPDVAYAYSRIGQHQASPNQSALEAVKYCFRYLKSTKRLCLSGENNARDVDITTSALFSGREYDDQLGWDFWVDTDFAGNSEKQNKRRSQIGILARYNKVPVYWSSKASSVCFANEDIGEAHADTSSASAEIYGAGNATQDILHLSYIAEEMGLPFPKPFVLQMDNDAARCFANDTVYRSKLKHIDNRQEWVQMLRDKEICLPVRIASAYNLADIFTKIQLSVEVFENLRDQLMHDPDK